MNRGPVLRAGKASGQSKGLKRFHIEEDSNNLGNRGGKGKGGKKHRIEESEQVLKESQKDNMGSRNKMNKMPNRATPSPSPEVEKAPTQPSIGPYAKANTEDVEEVKKFVKRFSTSERPIMDLFAKEIVHTISKKDLVYFVLQMKSALENLANEHAENDKANIASEPEVENKESEKPEFFFKVKRNSQVNNVAIPSTKASPTETPNRYTAQFYPLQEAATSSKKSKQIAEVQKRDQAEEGKWAKFLDVVDSELFYEGTDAVTLKENEIRHVLDQAAPLVRRVKDYLTIWNSLKVPKDTDISMEPQRDTVEMMITQCTDVISPGTIVSCLLKNQQIKLTVVQEVLKQHPHIFDHAPTFLANVIPTAKADFGWFRNGWSTKGWLQFVVKCLDIAPSEQRLELMNKILQNLREHEYTWEEDKKALFLQSCAKLSISETAIEF